MKEDDVVRLCINSILSQTIPHQYSLANNLMHLNGALVFFKLLFKRMFPDEFALIQARMISFDQLFLKSLTNSFADVFDSINFNMYLDFKTFFKIVMVGQESRLGLMRILREINLSFHVFIDVLYFIEAIKSHCTFLCQVEPPLYLQNVEKVLQLSFRNFPKVLEKMMKSIEFLFSSDFLREELFFFRKVLDNTLRDRIMHF